MTLHLDLNLLRYQRGKYATRNPISRRLLNGFFTSLRKSLQLVQEEDGIHQVVEFGCGEGVTTWQLQQCLPGASILGLDIHSPSLQVARHLVSGVSLLVGDARRMPLRDKSADLVVALEVLEHVHNPGLAVQEAARISRRWCIFSVPHEPIWRLLNLARGAHWHSLGNTPGHVNHWSWRSWTAFLGRYLEVVRTFTPLPWLIAVCRTWRST